VHAQDDKAAVEPDALDELEYTKRQLEESEARFRDIIERNADAIVVVDQAGVVRFANYEAARLFQQPADQLVGSSFGFPVIAGATTELDLPGNGHPRVVEMRVVESQWRGELACIASLRDVTERKRAEENLRELILEQAARGAAEQEARRFRFLAESSAALTSLNDEAVVTALARLCAAEISRHAVVYCFDATHTLQRSAVASRADDTPAAESAEVLRIADALVHGRDPGPHDYVVRMLPIVALAQKLGDVVLFAADPDELNEADIALAENLVARAALAISNARLYSHAREANQTKTELLAVISHDLRTPLNSIIGYGQLLEMGIPEPLPEGSRERVQRMLQSSNHLLYLIDELLGFARLEGNHEDVHVAPCDVGAVIREVAQLMEPMAEAKGLALHLHLPERVPSIMTDADKLRQVLVNLVGNAVKYTETGSIDLALEPADGRVEVRVTDTGVGIAAEDLPYIFKPFWQVDRAQRTNGGGTGLGLSVVQNVVRLLGGRISVHSTPGKGTTFTVVLPT
jgi:signal transduction histidine kinase